MTTLPSDLLTQVALHYGHFNPKIDFYNDVPIWFNATQIAYNLRYKVNQYPKFTLIASILSEVNRVAIEDASRNSPTAFWIQTLMAFPNSSAKSARKYLQQVGNDIPWDASLVRTFAVNTFFHGLLNMGNRATDPSLFQGEAMLYGEFIFSENYLPDNVDRTPATVRVAKAYSVGDCVIRAKMFSDISATVAQYVAYCLIRCNPFAFREIERIGEIRDDLIALLNAPGEVLELLLHIDTIFFIGNYYMENLLAHLHVASVEYADIPQPGVFGNLFSDINRSPCPHKYYTFNLIEDKVSELSKKAGEKDASRKLMYTTFIPVDQVKDFQLKDEIMDELKTTLRSFLVFNRFLFQGQVAKSKSLATNKMDFRKFYDRVCKNMDHWKTIGELVEDFYMMVYREQKWRILKGHSEEFIFSLFVNCRSAFDHLMLQSLEKHYFSIAAKKGDPMRLNACDHCKDEVRMRMRMP